MRKKIKISIGIPMFNEAKNILKLLDDIKYQENNNWFLEKVILNDDASTDSTLEELAKYKNLPLTIIKNDIRKGKALGLNNIFRKNRSEILILFDADIRLGGPKVLSNLIKHFLKDKNLSLLAGNKVPYLPRNFLERGQYSTFKVWHASRKYLNKGDNIFACQGGIMAMRKSFSNVLNLPEVVSDDAYIYLTGKLRSLKFKYADNVIIYYKLASNFRDYIKQYFRGTPTLPEYLNNYFGELVRKEIKRPMRFYIKQVWKVFVEDPFPTIFIILLNMALNLFIRVVTRIQKPYWPVATSTK